MRTVPVEEIVGLIEEAKRRDPGGAVAFDGDGTLWSGDIGEDFFEALIEAGDVSTVAHEALAREAAAEGVAADGSAVEIAKRIYAAYHAGSFPEERVCELMTWMCAGWTKARVDSFSIEIVEKIGLKERLHEEALSVVRHCRSAKIDLHIVSASPRPIVDAAARLIDVAPSCVTAVVERCDANAVILADVFRPIPYGPGKVKRLREKLGARVLYAAFGDNAFDVPLLQDAKIPVMIRPKQRLLDRAAEVPGVVVLERK